MGLYIPHYNESHSKPVPSFRNNDDHKMAFHTWHTQSAVKNNHKNLVSSLHLQEPFTNVKHFLKSST